MFLQIGRGILRFYWLPPCWIHRLLFGCLLLYFWNIDKLQTLKICLYVTLQCHLWTAHHIIPDWNIWTAMVECITKMVKLHNTEEQVYFCQFELVTIRSVPFNPWRRIVQIHCSDLMNYSGSVTFNQPILVRLLNVNDHEHSLLLATESSSFYPLLCQPHFYLQNQFPSPAIYLSSIIPVLLWATTVIVPHHHPSPCYLCRHPVNILLDSFCWSFLLIMSNGPSPLCAFFTFFFLPVPHLFYFIYRLSLVSCIPAPCSSTYTSAALSKQHDL